MSFRHFLIGFLVLIPLFLSASQKTADEIANLSSNSLAYMDKVTLKEIIDKYVQDKPYIMGLKISESLTKEEYINLHRKDGVLKYSQQTPSIIDNYKHYKAKVTFNGITVGNVLLYVDISFKDKLQLTKEEKNFLKNNPKIDVHMETGYAPFSYINNGKFIGYSIEYADLLSKILGVKFNYKQNVPWSQAIDDLKNFKIDMIAQMINSESRQRFTLFTKGYYTYYQGLVSRKDDGKYKSLKELDGKLVGVVKGYYTEDVIRKNYNSIKLKVYTDNTALLNGVVKREIDAAVTTYQIMHHAITERYLTDLVESYPLWNDPYLTETQEAFGVRKDWPLLRSAIQKAIDATIVERLEMQRKWFGATSETSTEVKKLISLMRKKNGLKKIH